MLHTYKTIKRIRTENGHGRRFAVLKQIDIMKNISFFKYHLSGTWWQFSSTYKSTLSFKAGCKISSMNLMTTMKKSKTVYHNLEDKVLEV